MLRHARDEEGRGQVPHRRRGREDPFQLFMEIDDMDEDDYGEESEDKDINSQSEANEELCSYCKETSNFYGRSKVIRTLRAAIQTPLAGRDGPWLSENFSLQVVLNGLNNVGLLPIILVEDIMAPFC